jgi:hypothetical protein
LGKEGNTLVVKTSDRDNILAQISAQAAKYKRDPEIFAELQTLRKNVRDIFNKGLQPGDDIMEELYFLDKGTRDVLAKMSKNYDRIVTPADFQKIAKIMSEHLELRVPILKEFTQYFGRLGEDFLKHAKPKNSAIPWKEAFKVKMLGDRESGYRFPRHVARLLGVSPNKSFSEQMLEKFPFWKPNGTLSEFIYGVKYPDKRANKLNLVKVGIKKIDKKFTIVFSRANKLPKSWTNVPWVNFDKKVLEQNYTKKFEERLTYKNEDGEWVNNIVQIPQKTEASWWDQVVNKEGTINDIADAGKAKTAFGVNGNHSNDAVLVKRFHEWGADNKIPTSTIHDAFFTNAGQMLQARHALRKIYADTLEVNIIKEVLDEMKRRGLSQELYDKYLQDAIDRGLIPVKGKSVIGGRTLKEEDILKKDQILQEVKENFDDDRYWYGVG